MDFRSAASASAVCTWCRSTLVREGEALRRIGESAEVFDDHSPLQLGVTGSYLGRAFTLVGRLQLRYAEGSWNEWHALFDDSGEGAAGPTGGGTPKIAWLSEDNGRYVFSFEAPLSEAAPSRFDLMAGGRCSVAGQAWSVASVTAVQVGAAQGELPHAPPPPELSYTVVDLRNTRDEVGSLDYADPQQPVWSIGRGVRLSELKLQGLRTAEDSAAAMKGRSIECPSCGASLEVRLDSTRSLTCGQCKAVVDISKGVGADMAHYAQANGMAPQIPLGSTGKLALGTTELLPWQVVGYMERCDLPEEDGDEQTFWREYLLYHRTEGFVFLVDAEDGWSWARPLTGVPEQSSDRATWAGVRYKRRWAYAAKTTYVLGEFYWRVRRNERSQVDDYDGEGTNARKRLSREQQNMEIVWSAGETLDAGDVADAFGILPGAREALRRDAAPTSFKADRNWPLMLTLILVALMILWAMRSCDSGRCDDVRRAFGESSLEYQQCLRSSGSYGGSSGGSWGGYSSGGGGHK